jgi:hypothetical protein
MTKKMTKREMFEQLKANYDLTVEEIAFIDHELELLANRGSKRSNKPTAKQVENESYKLAILSFLEENAGKAFRITELLKEVEELNDLTNQKVSALMRQLIETDQVERVEEKQKAFFKFKE